MLSEHRSNDPVDRYGFVGRWASSRGTIGCRPVERKEANGSVMQRLSFGVTVPAISAATREEPVKSLRRCAVRR